VIRKPARVYTPSLPDQPLHDQLRQPKPRSTFASTPIINPGTPEEVHLIAEYLGKEKTRRANFQNRSLALPATLVPIKQLPPPSPSRPSTAPFPGSARSSPPVSFHRRRSSYHNNCLPSSPRRPPQLPHTPTSLIPLRHRLSGSTERSCGNRSLKRVPSCVSASAVSRPSSRGSTKLSRPSTASMRVRKKGVLARGQNCQKEESGNHQNNRFVTIATDAQL